MKLEGKKLAQVAAELAGEKQATNVVIMDITKANFVADYIVIASADNFAQVGAIANNIDAGLRARGAYPYHTETDRKSTWMLLDYSDVVIHVFEEGARKFYSLERLWGDAKIVEVEEAKAVVTKKAKVVKKKVGGVKKNVGAGKAKPKARAKKSTAK